MSGVAHASSVPGRPTLTTVTLNASDPARLARFYSRLLDWPVTTEEPDWVQVGPRDGGVGLAFQREPRYAPPTWPAQPGAQQMMVHLEIRVDDLAAAEAHAAACGASLADHQPQDDVRVYLDPDGHPFCLWLGR
ncbi:MAG TPA: VOC family protein [Pilimelia sp.]|nr:VOC family protein [Pilimelia sp.]